MKNYSKLSLSLAVLLTILPLATIRAASLCNNLEAGKTCDQTKTVNLIDTEANFNKYFQIVQGDHVGPHETEKYMSSQVRYQNSTVTINTNPLAQKISCLANGGFDGNGPVLSGPRPGTGSDRSKRNERGP